MNALIFLIGVAIRGIQNFYDAIKLNPVKFRENFLKIRNNPQNFEKNLNFVAKKSFKTPEILPPRDVGPNLGTNVNP